MTPSRAIMLFGTEEPVEQSVTLSAGTLTAELDAGGLRYIRLGGKEVLRGVAFLVRDRNWGTYNPAIKDLKIDTSSDGFTVSYNAECRDAAQTFRYSARIEGHSNGALKFSATGEALSDFVTNRTGFVVLHALEGVVGAPVKVEHTDGRIVESNFPEIINPACPFQDVRALTHEIAPGVRASVRMEGDAFEMEDHRNWMDASYKTYVRPLALPWPYTIPKGAVTEQSVSIAIEGSLAAPVVGSGAAGFEVSIGAALPHSLPRLGLAVPAEHADGALVRADLIAALNPAHLICHFDGREGHDAETMTAFRNLAQAVGAEPVLEAVVPCLDANGKPSADLAILRRDLAAIAEAANQAGLSFARVAVSPSTDLKCTLPGSVFPPAPDWADLMSAARAEFPGALVGGGMFSYFTELNRKRPPADLLDFIFHSGCPIVHAGDDVSVIETLESLPSQFASVRAFGGGKPHWVFPTAISMRDNPYGAAPAENPDNIRQAMNRVDPRERGLLGSAWYAGYLARAAQAGIDAVTLAAVAGPPGVIFTAQDHAQPWFDGGEAVVLPHYHVLAGYASQSGKVHASVSSDGRAVQALAVAGPDGVHLTLVNLTGAEIEVALTGVKDGAEAIVLDETTFADACRNPRWRHDAARHRADRGKIALRPYAVAEIRAPA